MTSGYRPPVRTAERPRDLSRPLPAVVSWTVLAVFVAAFAIAVVTLNLPWWMPVLSGILSLVAFAAYGIDKAAARGDRRRVSEQSLLTLGLLGGWPGAVLAQQLFRHKTRKRSFRRAFWGTVVVNVAALTGLVVYAAFTGISLELPIGR